MTTQELSLPGREGRTGYFFGGRALFLFPRLLSLCSLSFKYGRHWGRNYGVSPWLLLLLGRAVPKGWCSPQSCVEQRIPGGKKKKESFQLLCSLLPRVPFSCAGSNPAPTSSLNQSSSAGHLQIEVPHLGCTWSHSGSPTLDQSSWSHWGWVRGTHILKSFQMILPCHHSQGAQVWGVCRLSLNPSSALWLLLVSGWSQEGLDAGLTLPSTACLISECESFRTPLRGLVRAYLWGSRGMKVDLHRLQVQNLCNICILGYCWRFTNKIANTVHVSTPHCLLSLLYLSSLLYFSAGPLIAVWHSIFPLSLWNKHNLSLLLYFIRLYAIGEQEFYFSFMLHLQHLEPCLVQVSHKY